MMAMFQLSLNATGRGKLIIDGQDVSHLVRDLTLRGGADGPATLEVTFVAGTVEAGGFARVTKVTKVTEGAPSESSPPGPEDSAPRKI